VSLFGFFCCFECSLWVKVFKDLGPCGFVWLSFCGLVWLFLCTPCVLRGALRFFNKTFLTYKKKNLNM
jgi:hypothetical protein